MSILCALLLAAAPDANLSLLRPASGSDGLLGVEGARPPNDPSEPLQLQLGFEAGYKPVRLGPGAAIDSRLGGWVQLSARLNDLVSVFALLPVTLHQDGDLTALGATAPELGFAVGDVRLGARHSFLRGPLDVAGQVALEFATGRSQSLTTDQRLVGEALVAVAARRGDWEWIGNAFLRLRPPRDLAGVEVGNELGLRGGAVRWLSGHSRVYLELELQTSLRAFAQESFPIEWRAGATVCPMSAIALDLGGGTRLDDGLGAPTVRGVLALRFAPSFCAPPRKPTGPEPGLKELVAQIAKERAEREKVEQEQKLPKLVQRSEAEAKEELARSEARVLLPPSESHAIARGEQYAEEDTRDTDGDGVPDSEDNCPTQKGPKSNHGCPVSEKQVVSLGEKLIQINEKVYFAPGKTLIHPRSTRLLNQIARVLKTHPELVRLDVQGHTDSRGGMAVNMALSQARAEAVVGALIRRGVAGSRLVAHGFGPTRPVAPNDTAAGREQNRRVEFRVIQRKIAGEVVDVER